MCDENMTEFVGTADVIEEISYCSDDPDFLESYPGILSLVAKDSWIQEITDTANDFIRQNKEIENYIDAIHMALYCYWTFDNCK